MLAVSGRKRDNRHKLKQERPQLDVRKKKLFTTMRTLKQWNWLPRETENLQESRLHKA